jgi:hypothetical protein
MIVSKKSLETRDGSRSNICFGKANIAISDLRFSTDNARFLDLQLMWRTTLRPHLKLVDVIFCGKNYARGLRST